VRKSYEERRRKRHVKGQGRSWKLKRMAMDTEDTMQLKKGQQAQADRRQQDLERFMQVRLLCQAVPASGMCSCICCCSDVSH